MDPASGEQPLLYEGSRDKASHFKKTLRVAMAPRKP